MITELNSGGNEEAVRTTPTLVVAVAASYSRLDVSYHQIASVHVCASVG